VKQDRFLTAILIGIGLLAIAALALFFVRQRQVDFLAEETPNAVVHNYVLALNKGDYERAYGYLADLSGKPSFDQFRQVFLTRQIDVTSASLQIGETQTVGDSAYVSVTVISSNGDPFGQAYRNSQSAALVLQSGSWKISSLPNHFWYWDWYQPTPIKSP
jgi:hypothetical protein